MLLGYQKSIEVPLKTLRRQRLISSSLNLLLCQDCDPYLNCNIPIRGGGFGFGKGKLGGEDESTRWSCHSEPGPAPHSGPCPSASGHRLHLQNA